MTAPHAELDFLDPPGQEGSLGRLGPYEILEVIGRGAVGVVLKGHEPRLARDVAIKVLAAQLTHSAPARRRFAREGRATAALTHENVVVVHTVVDQGPRPYLVMEYVPGSSLQQRLAEAGALPLEEVVHIGAQLAAGLAAAHDKGLVHRDVKPGNVLLESTTGRVKITDFGLVQQEGAVSQTDLLVGTPLFMSPEQARGEKVDARSDLFSLGSVLYAMCTGRPPFEAPSPLAVLQRVSEGQPPPISQLRREAPAWLVDLIARLHGKDPSARPAAAEVARELYRRLEEGVRAEPKRRRWLAWVAAGLVVLAAVAAVGLTHLLGRGGNEEVEVESPEPAGSGPFLVLPRGGERGLRTATLAEALAGAGDGDTVEVQGDGPFVVPPLPLRRRLTIRAGVGHQPLLRHDGSRLDQPLLDVFAPLVLEGLTLEGPGYPTVKDGWFILVRSGNVPLHIGGCRLQILRDGTCIYTRGPLELRQSALVRSDCGHAALDWWGDPGTEALLEQCLFVSGHAGVWLGVNVGKPPARSVRLRHCTIATHQPLAVMLRDPQLRKAPPAGPLFRLDVSGCVLDGTSSVLLLVDETARPGAPLPAATLEGLLTRLVRFQDGGNLYPVAEDYLYLSFHGDAIPTTRKRPRLADWWSLWGLPATTEGLRARVRYRGADGDPHRLEDPRGFALGDLRLATGSPGKGSADGRDLGADVDQVGPGEALDRWRKSAAYRDWRRRVAEVMAGGRKGE